MRIDDRHAVSGSAAGRSADIEQAHTSSSRALGSNLRLGGDSVELSGASVAVRSYTSERSAQLQQLAKAVQSGSYYVNPSKVSQALVTETLAAGQGL